MFELQLFNYYKKMREQNIILAFKGTISQEILAEMAEIIKNKLSKESVKTTVAKKVFAIFIELAQNINLYSAERVTLNNSTHEIGTGIILLREDKDFYTITSGNLIENTLTINIMKRINYINQLDKEELKQFYKDQLKLPRNENNQTGGIGLIEMARKTENLLEYKINHIDNTYSFFVLSVRIQKDKKYEEPQNT